MVPTSAAGGGTIDPKTLLAVIIGNPTKISDGNIIAALTAANYSLLGLIGSETITVNQTVGSYASPNAGPRLVTATLGSGDFTAGSGTLLSNYVLPTSAAGAGTIDRRALTAAIIGNPTKTYDGTAAATLTSANYQLGGFVTGESATVTEASGLYDSSNAGARTVSATLDGGDFVAASGTLLSNYILPTDASGAGTIDRKGLTAIIIGNPTKAYDGTVAATLTGANYLLAGFVGSDSAAVTQTAGTYNSPNAGVRIVTASLASGDFLAGGSTLLSNYVLPTSASGAGTIDRLALTVAIIGNPTKAYDGNMLARLTGANFTLSGFIAGEGGTVTETAGTYDSKNAGARTVTASLQTGDFAADSGTLLANYVLPTTATGAGTINPTILRASIIGLPTKTYDATTASVLTPGNFALAGFVSGEGATITETVGVYGTADAGIRLITAALGANDYVANSGTLLSNYILPTSAIGAGIINKAQLTALIIGNPTKIYDRTTDATLTSANYQLVGFVGGQGATITETAGTYESRNVGLRLVTAMLGSADFVGDAGTDLRNYALPLTATGLGTIDPKVLTLIFLGIPTKVYDGNDLATLAGGDFRVEGFVSGEGIAIESKVQGTYNNKNVGLHTVTADPTTALFIARPGTLISNYIVRPGASGVGRIIPAPLTASLVDVFKTYDGTTAALLAPTNFVLNGFVAGEGASVTETVGLFASPNAGQRAVSAALDAGDFTADAGTLLSNYNLPVMASGMGTINPALLSAVIIGNPTKTYDGTLAALLGSANYQISGFVGGDGATVTETAGTYDTPNAGPRTVTAMLDASDFTATGSTLLANYVLPTEAMGAGTIDPRTLTAAIIGNPTKIYDGNIAAILASANFQLSGFVTGEGATVTQTAGTYDDANAGARTVTATLASGDFSADGGTLLSNYVLPTDANGAGTIDRRQLGAIIIGNPTKIYDGNDAALLASANYQLDGFVGGEGATVTETAGLYDTPNAGPRTVTAALEDSDFVANGGTLLANYILPTSASGAGQIDPRALSAVIIGNPTKVYDATTAAILAAGNYALTGFITGEGATITQTVGSYDTKNAGARTVTATLGLGDFAAAGGTLLSNYILPTSAVGPGQIDRATLTAAITGNPTKAFDGNTEATLTSGDYSISGFVGGEGAVITETQGSYDDSSPGSRTVTVSLDSGDFAANAGTDLANYILPTEASGPGTIIGGTGCLPVDTGGCDPDTPDIIARYARTVGNFRFYVPYPALDPIYLGRTNGFAGLPSTILPWRAQRSPNQLDVETGARTINSTEQILLQGRRDKAWTIQSTLPTTIRFEALP